jgi:hypothetical protein
LWVLYKSIFFLCHVQLWWVVGSAARSVVCGLQIGSPDGFPILKLGLEGTVVLGIDGKEHGRLCIAGLGSVLTSAQIPLVRTQSHDDF